MTKLLARIALALIIAGLATVRGLGPSSSLVARADTSTLYSFPLSGFVTYINTPTVQGNLLVLQSANPAGSCCYQTGVGAIGIPQAYEPTGSSLQWGVLACSSTAAGGTPTTLNFGVQNGHGDDNELSVQGQLGITDQFSWLTSQPASASGYRSTLYAYIPGSLHKTVYVRDLVLGDPVSVGQYIAAHQSEPDGVGTCAPCQAVGTSATLGADCAGPLIVTGNNLVLDLGGHRVTCNGTHAQNGIVVNGHTGVQVTNGEVTGCNIGLQFSGNGSPSIDSGNHFTNLLIDHNNSGAFADPTYGNTFSNDTITSNPGLSLRLGGTSSDNSFDSMTVTNNGYGLEIDILSSHNTLTNSDLSNNKNFGLYVCCYNYHGLGSATGNVIKHVTIDNTSSGSGYTFAVILSGQNNTFTDSTIDGSYSRGIILGGQGYDAERNTVENAAASGISVQGAGGTVAGNTVTNNGGNGIEVVASTTGNLIYGNRSLSNAGYDLADYPAGACTANTWGSPTVNYAANLLDGCETGDTTPPVITPHISGTLGANGWYTSDVTVSWDVSDPETPITSTSGCDASSITTDTAGQTLTCVATSPGGANSVSVSIKRDASAPTTVAPTPSRAPDYNGWYNAPFTIQWSGTENISTPLGCTSASYPGNTQPADMAAGSLTGSCTNDAGLTSELVPFLFKYDGTTPTITPTVASASGLQPVNGWYSIATGAPSASFSCSAGVSGVSDSTPCPGPHTFGEGSHQSFTSSTITSDAGLTSQPASVSSINVDLTAPTIHLTATSGGSPYTGGWTNHDVQVSFSCQDPQLVDGSAGSGIASCPSSSTVSQEGTSTVSGQATDTAGNASTLASLSTMIDKTAPACTVSLSPSSIWPPNKKMVPVTATVKTSDAGSGVAGFVLKSLTTNEGSITTEAAGWTLNAPSTSGTLQADRSGNGTGRVYTFTYLVTDRAGNSSTCTGAVTVPHDQGK